MPFKHFFILSLLVFSFNSLFGPYNVSGPSLTLPNGKNLSLNLFPNPSSASTFGSLARYTVSPNDAGEFLCWVQHVSRQILLSYDGPVYIPVVVIATLVVGKLSPAVLPLVKRLSPVISPILPWAGSLDFESVVIPITIDALKVSFPQLYSLGQSPFLGQVGLPPTS